ncbi:50S ribosomal protein L11 methyltransferase [Aurantiacibacter xanthus]|uniref:Ribosomal protein L11 methyltransferase n=1 Tax=Aurantiacibacter xanthus TaxID=1784712 RepID=A0A3A1P4G1_9SPHN|nr:50S ribosomal protein L11 methyltransferase [Aurantiacibacter xanthus]RIV87223.1 50S ribosomal protein L11 methyltransferase [Aurantiacibacter xanthus]
MSWKLSAITSREAVEQALDRAEGWDEALVLAAFEVDPDEPDVWQLDAYCEGKPGKAERAAVAALFDGNAPEIKAEELPDADWVSESQKGAQPIRAGRFYVHTPEHPASEEPGVTSFCIPAAQAFGTGQHATTAGCLEMLDTMRADGIVPRDVADIGTGTGLLAFAARDLWPKARYTVSDIDPLCTEAVIDNALRNGIPLGTEPGKVVAMTAEGMDHELLHARAPYDLLIANILAAPLIELAPDFAAALAPRGSVLLAGLLATQESTVRRAYRRHGLRLHKRIQRGDWSILWLRARYVG